MKLILNNNIRVTELEGMKRYKEDLNKLYALFKSGKIDKDEKKLELKKINERYIKMEEAMERIIDQWQDLIDEAEKVKNGYEKIYSQIAYK